MHTIAYKLIQAFYGDKVANRSQVPLINHIDEGLILLDYLSADQDTKDAFCIHPMIQDDHDLKMNWATITKIVDPTVIMLAMEYRSVANEFLSDRTDGNQRIRLSPLYQVQDMLIADKVQNRKDFELYHKGTHENSEQLDRYFKLWLERLHISENVYVLMKKKLTS